MKKKTQRITLNSPGLFSEESPYDRKAVKRIIIENNLIPYGCATEGCPCKNGEWRGKPITLQLEHKNGIGNDNRLENLEFLCPSCHSQTDTFRGKNTARAKKSRSTQAPFHNDES